MKTLTVRLPEPLVSEIEAESRGSKCSKSDIVRERLQRPARPARRRSSGLDGIADLIGSIDGLPADLSAHRKRKLKATEYSKKRAR
jgi:Arc/MetJ-type ribon-helix-helix transcriptional regulator